MCPTCNRMVDMLHKVKAFYKYICYLKVQVERESIQYCCNTSKYNPSFMWKKKVRIYYYLRILNNNLKKKKLLGQQGFTKT